MHGFSNFLFGGKVPFNVWDYINCGFQIVNESHKEFFEYVRNYYLENQYGIRCENLVFIKKHNSQNGDSFFEFEDLTMAPFDKRLFDMKLLTDSDIKWINNYHQKVYESVSKGLDDQQEIDWLKKATSPIN